MTARLLRRSLCWLSLTWLAAAALPIDGWEFTPSAYQHPNYVAVRLLVEGPHSADALGARAVVEEALHDGSELPTTDPGRSTIGTELDRPDGRIVTWLHFEVPRGGIEVIERITGKFEFLVGGEPRQLVAKDFRNKRPKKVTSAEMKAVGIEVKAGLTEVPALRLEVKGSAAELTDLSMEGAQVDYHSLYDRSGGHLVAHLKKKKLPRRAVIVVEVTEPSGKVHSARIEDIELPKEPTELAVPELALTGVKLTLSTGVCSKVEVDARSKEFELVSAELHSRGEVLGFDEVRTTNEEATALLQTKSYWNLPEDAQLVLEHREGAEWQEVPLVLNNVKVRKP